MTTKNIYIRIGLPDRVFAVTILTIATGLAGCAQNDGPGLGERTGRQIDQAASRAGETVQDTQRSLGEQTDKTGEYLSDAVISSRIRADLLNDPLLTLSDIRVTTTAGVVTLSGTVNSQQAIDRAVEIARKHPNVKTVENKLMIRAPSRI